MIIKNIVYLEFEWVYGLSQGTDGKLAFSAGGRVHADVHDPYLCRRWLWRRRPDVRIQVRAKNGRIREPRHGVELRHQYVRRVYGAVYFRETRHPLGVLPRSQLFGLVRARLGVGRGLTHVARLAEDHRVHQRVSVRVLCEDDVGERAARDVGRRRGEEHVAGL